MSCGVVRRRGSDLAWLWLWRRPAATALIRPPRLGTPVCHGCSPKKTKKKKKEKKNSFPTQETHHTSRPITSGEVVKPRSQKGPRHLHNWWFPNLSLGPSFYLFWLLLVAQKKPQNHFPLSNQLILRGWCWRPVSVIPGFPLFL